MKKNQLFVSLLAAGMLAISPAMADDMVRFTTNKSIGETIILKLNQTDSDVKVDWGDGNLTKYEPTTDKLLTVEGKVAGTDITISSSAGIETLICSNAGITKLDVSGASSLRSLYCQNNEIDTLNVTSLKGLTDLNCSNNKIVSFTMTEATNPNMETLNISGNKIAGNRGDKKTTFGYSSPTLHYLNISNNEFTGSVSLGGSVNLDVVKAVGNHLTSIAAKCDSISVVMCGDNKINTLAFNANKPSLRQVFAENNALTTLNVSSAPQLQYVAVDNNKLTSVTLPTGSIYAYTCSNNKLAFNSLPDPNSVDHFVYAPQAEELSIHKKLNSMYDKTTQKTIYYLLTNTDRQQFKKGKAPYTLNLRDYVLNAAGSASGITVELMDASATPETEIAKTDLFTMNGSSYVGMYSFKKPFSKVYAKITSSDFPELTLKTSSFMVVEKEEDVTGIGNVAVANNALTVEATKGAVVLTSGAPCVVRIYSIDGKQVWQGSVNGTQTVNLATGNYFVNGKKVVL